MSLLEQELCEAGYEAHEGKKGKEASWSKEVFGFKITVTKTKTKTEKFYVFLCHNPKGRPVVKIALRDHELDMEWVENYWTYMLGNIIKAHFPDMFDDGIELDFDIPDDEIELVFDMEEEEEEIIIFV